MDIIRFRDTNAGNGFMRDAVPVEGIKTKMWIERSDKPGEFTFTAEVSSNLQSKLPLDSIISHVDTGEVMIVENHEIKSVEDGEDEITVSGRSFLSFLEHRIYGEQDLTGTATDTPESIVLPADTWNAQLIALLDGSVLNTGHFPPDMGSWLSNLTTFIDEPVYIPEDPEVPALESELNVGRKNLLELYEELSASGRASTIRVLRPGPWLPSWYTADKLYLTNRWNFGPGSDEVVFSSAAGDISKADYLWTTKDFKNSVVVVGKWFEVKMNLSPVQTGFRRRTMVLDASSIDSMYTTRPTGGTATTVKAKLRRAGLDALAKKNGTSITRVETTKDLSRYRYRYDFDIASVVHVHAEYGAKAMAKVVEYVEIEDEQGERGYPTLKLIN